MTSVDQIAYEVLTQTGTALYALVGTRVDFATAPDGFQNSAARVVFRPEDGEAARWGSAYHERSYLFECYGGTNNDWVSAAAVYEALHDLWHDARNVAVASGVLMGGWEEQAGGPLVHPKTGHRYYVCRMAGKLRGA